MFFPNHGAFQRLPVDVRLANRVQSILLNHPPSSNLTNLIEHFPQATFQLSTDSIPLAVAVNEKFGDRLDSIGLFAKVSLFDQLSSFGHRITRLSISRSSDDRINIDLSELHRLQVLDIYGRLPIELDRAPEHLLERLSCHAPLSSRPILRVRHAVVSHMDALDPTCLIELQVTDGPDVDLDPFVRLAKFEYACRSRGVIRSNRVVNLCSLSIYAGCSIADTIFAGRLLLYADSVEWANTHRVRRIDLQQVSENFAQQFTGLTEICVRAQLELHDYQQFPFDLLKRLEFEAPWSCVNCFDKFFDKIHPATQIVLFGDSERQTSQAHQLGAMFDAPPVRNGSGHQHDGDVTLTKQQLYELMQLMRQPKPDAPFKGWLDSPLVAAILHQRQELIDLFWKTNPKWFSCCAVADAARDVGAEMVDYITNTLEVPLEQYMRPPPRPIRIPPPRAVEVEEDIDLNMAGLFD